MCLVCFGEWMEGATGKYVVIVFHLHFSNFELAAVIKWTIVGLFGAIDSLFLLNKKKEKNPSFSEALHDFWSLSLLTFIP